MLDKEPLSYPSRNRYPYNPGVPDRQLWAIGMIVVQWSMTEWFIDVDTRKLIGEDKVVLDEYQKLRNFQQRIDFWQTQLELKSKDPVRSEVLTLIPIVKNLNSQRDEVVHRLWGGGMEGSSWASDGLETADAGLLPNPGEKFKTKADGGPIPFTWNASFARLRRMASEMAALNQGLLQILVLPRAPHAT